MIEILIILLVFIAYFSYKYFTKVDSSAYENKHTYAINLYSEDDNEENDLLVYVVSPEKMNELEIEKVKEGILNKLNASDNPVKFSEAGVVYIGMNKQRKK